MSVIGCAHYANEYGSSLMLEHTPNEPRDINSSRVSRTGNPLKLSVPPGPALVGDEMGRAAWVDVAADWCHEPVLKLDAGPPSGTRDCCCEHVSAPL